MKKRQLSELSQDVRKHMALRCDVNKLQHNAAKLCQTCELRAHKSLTFFGRLMSPVCLFWLLSMRINIQLKVSEFRS